MNPEFFINNRTELMKKLPDKSLAVIFSGNVIRATADTEYPFETDRNFYYFTGIAAPGMFLLLYRDGPSLREYLLIPRPDPSKEKWTGKMYSLHEASAVSGVLNTLCTDELDDLVYSMAAAGALRRFYMYYEPRRSFQSPSAGSIIRDEFMKKYPGTEICSLSELTMPMRALKTDEEIQTIRIAAKLTKYAFEECMKNLRGGMREYEIQAVFEYAVRSRGGALAFNSIAASGRNALTLHYVRNADIMKEGDLVLMDCGASFEWYNSDVTRTFPVSGTFSELQLKIYNIVLAANEYIISSVRPGISCSQLNSLLTDFYKKELMSAALIDDESETAECYYHGVSHSLGLDTHDVFDRSMPLEPGMVITVEPGLYFEKYGIGIRIEDDVLVTSGGCEVLTADIIKKPEEIEEYMKKGRQENG